MRLTVKYSGALMDHLEKDLSELLEKYGFEFISSGYDFNKRERSISFDSEEDEDVLD